VDRLIGFMIILNRETMMRWKPRYRDVECLTRIRHKFLWSPEYDGQEWRWLEWATVQEGLYTSEAGRWWSVEAFIDDKGEAT